MSLPRYFRLANGCTMPSIGLGTFQMRGDKLKEALDYALYLGYSHIDTAASYGNEREIGEVISDRIKSGSVKRKDLFITSKVPRNSLQECDVLACAQKSLEDLKLLSLDMFLIHNPWSCVVDKDESGNPQDRHVHLNILETWAAFESLCNKGLVSNIGVSNFTIEQIQKVLDVQKVPLSNVQSEAHVYYQQRNLKQFCDDNNIVFSAYSPLGAPGRPNRHVTGNESVLKDPLILKISERYKKTPAQVLLNFLLNCGMVVLPKSTSTERMRENFNCIDWSLSDSDFKAVQGLNSGVKFFKFLHMREHPDFAEGKEF